MTRAKHVVTVGQRFGKLEVTDPERRIAYPGSPETYRAAECRCDCGAVTVKQISGLVRGGFKSCGCGLAEIRGNFGRSAGAATGRAKVAEIARANPGVSSHELYGTWKAMRARCYNPRQKHFHNYGGRGIRVCAEWHDWSVFIQWIEANLGPRPAGMSLDRIDNDGNYEPGNVRWATASEQVRNQRKGKGGKRVSRIPLLEAEVARLRERVKELEAKLTG